jgi:hypothetical protein
MLFFPNPSATNFELAIFLEIVQKLDNENSPKGPEERRCKCCSGGVYGSYERDARINFREGSLD